MVLKMITSDLMPLLILLFKMENINSAKLYTIFKDIWDSISIYFCSSLRIDLILINTN